jgi:hypothetical protein
MKKNPEYLIREWGPPFQKGFRGKEVDRAPIPVCIYRNISLADQALKKLFIYMIL